VDLHSCLESALTEALGAGGGAPHTDSGGSEGLQGGWAAGVSQEGGARKEWLARLARLHALAEECEVNGGASVHLEAALACLLADKGMRVRACVCVRVGGGEGGGAWLCGRGRGVCEQTRVFAPRCMGVVWR